MRLLKFTKSLFLLMTVKMERGVVEFFRGRGVRGTLCSVGGVPLAFSEAPTLSPPPPSPLTPVLWMCTPCIWHTCNIGLSAEFGEWVAGFCIMWWSCSGWDWHHLKCTRGIYKVGLYWRNLRLNDELYWWNEEEWGLQGNCPPPHLLSDHEKLPLFPHPHLAYEVTCCPLFSVPTRLELGF